MKTHKDLLGTFSIAGEQLPGLLRIRGRRSRLKLHATRYFDTRVEASKTIHGLLDNGQRVTLVDCLTLGSDEFSQVGSTGVFTATIFPHFIVLGPTHLIPDVPTVKAIEIVVDDAQVLFYDFDAFGIARNPEQYIHSIILDRGHERGVETGPKPHVMYYAGKDEIFTAETPIGLAKAFRRTRRSLGDASGVFIKGTTFVSLQFEELETFSSAMERAYLLARYLGLIVGRPQYVQRCAIYLGQSGEEPEECIVLPSYPLQKRQDRFAAPHFRDIVLDPVREPEKFSLLLTRWLSRPKSWVAARHRFFVLYSKQRWYDPDRLVAAANMFDLIPKGSLPAKMPLGDDLKKARDESRAAFRALSDSQERSDILQALSRLERHNLKSRVRARASLLPDNVKSQLPHFDSYLNEAINARNHFVHGSDSRIDFDRFRQILWSFVDTLLFVFATTDLIDAGWDMSDWFQKGRRHTHPFGTYIHHYPAYQEELTRALAEGESGTD